MAKELAIPGFTFARIEDEVSSTMDVAREAIPNLGVGAGVVCALSQSAGRGRQGRRWSSTHGAMMATLLFQTSAPVASLSGYSLVVGLGLVDAFERFGAQLQLKWPNDLVIVRNGELKKIGGILIEVQDLGDKRVVLVGVGVNLARVPDDVPHAASIEEISGRLLSVEDSLVAVAEQLRIAHELFVSLGGFARFRHRWEDASCFAKGKTEIVLDLGEREAAGTYSGVDERGSLLLEVVGKLEAFHSGHALRIRNLKSFSVT
jgi:BirA family biotin operon repressor/biotin-[acetyl-CoA-carboxylase] ligase